MEFKKIKAREETSRVKTRPAVETRYATCTTLQVGRLMGVSALPTSGMRREACAPRPYMASLIINVGPTGSFRPRTGQASIACRHQSMRR